MANSAGTARKHKRILSPEKKMKLKGDYLSGNYTEAQLAELYGVSRPAISRIVQNEKWNKEKEAIEQNASNAIIKTTTSKLVKAAAHRADEAFSARKEYIDDLHSLRLAIAKKIDVEKKKPPEKLSVYTIENALALYEKITNTLLKLSANAEWMKHGKQEFAQCNTLAEIAAFVTAHADAYSADIADTISMKTKLVAKKAETDSKNKIPVQALQEFINLTGKMIEVYVPMDKKLEAMDVMEKNVSIVEKMII